MIGLQQAIYTPPSNRRTPVPGERPNAGYLGASTAVTYLAGPVRRSMLLSVGTTGRPSLAEPVQRVVHSLTGSDPELGWHAQLVARPTLSVRYDEQRTRAQRSPRLQLLTIARWGAELGTLRTDAHAAAEARVTLGRRTTWVPGDAGAAPASGAFLLAGVQPELVLRDVFVDGHPGDASVTSVRVPAVLQLSGGIGWRWGTGGSIEYRLVQRTREYRAQPRAHRYGRFTITLAR
jgi:hypothetical protein